MPNTQHSKPTTRRPQPDELTWAEQAAWDLHNELFPDPDAQDVLHVAACTDPECEFCHPPAITWPDPAPAPTYDEVPF